MRGNFVPASNNAPKYPGLFSSPYYCILVLIVLKFWVTQDFNKEKKILLYTCVYCVFQSPQYLVYCAKSHFYIGKVSIKLDLREICYTVVDYILFGHCINGSCVNLPEEFESG
jgi:hypothetical protein